MTFALAAELLLLAGVDGSAVAARDRLQRKLADGEALRKFVETITTQGGDARVCEQPSRLPRAPKTRPIVATASGYVQSIAADQIGYAVSALGGGRRFAGESIDPAVGFEQPRKLGDRVEAGEPLMVMHYREERAADEAERLVQQAYQITVGPPPKRPAPIVARLQSESVS